MKRESKNHGPLIKPKEHISLSENHTTARLVLTLLLIAVALFAFTVAITNLTKTDSGWREVEVKSSAQTICATEFSFQYQLGRSGVSPTEEYKRLEQAYTDVSDAAFKTFSSDVFDGVNNLAYLNAHVNEPVEIEDALYEALTLLDRMDSRYLYFAPIYEQYRGLFSCEEDSEAMNFDPYRNPEIAAYCREITAFANDPETVDIRLLEDGRAELFVSEDYLKYAKENGITMFVDLFWMRNAFIIDEIADSLEKQGFTYGTITSFDGFSRTLDNSGTEYALHLYGRIGQSIYPAAVLRYAKPMSIVSLRGFYTNALDAVYYYEWSDGEIRTPYVDLTDGLCKNAVNHLAAYSESRSCAETALTVLSLYAADTLDEAALLGLSADEITVLYCVGEQVHATAADAKLTDYYQDENVAFVRAK